MDERNVSMLDKVSVAARFSSFEPGRFGDELDKRIAWVGKLADPVKDAVEEGILTPVDGLALTSCITGRLFGYEEFHGPQPIANALLGWASNQQQQTGRNTPVATH